MTYSDDDVKDDDDGDIASEGQSSVFVLLERLLQILSPSGIHL